MLYNLEVNGLALNSSFLLTEEQIGILKDLIQFLQAGVVSSQLETYLLTLSGSAGTGKTSLLKLLVQYNNRMGNKRKNILAASLTHKARKVLDYTLNKNAFIKVPTCTIAALLKKQKQAGFVGTKKYLGKGSTLGNYDLVIIDEVSMVSDKDFEQISRWAGQYGTKILFIGDPAQIPHPTQRLVEYDGKLEKKDTAAFSLKNRLHLTQVMRQGKGNPILDICEKIRQDLRAQTDLYAHESAMTTSGEGVQFTKDVGIFTEAIREYFATEDESDILQAKILVYTNQAVDHYNHLVRQLRYSEEVEPFVLGDVLMGYENVGFPDPFIENGQEYMVTAVQRISDHMISIDKDMGVQTPVEGYKIIIQERNRGTDSDVLIGKSVIVFFPDIYSDSNYQILQELLHRAERVNRYGSTKEDYKNYQQLKEQLLFLESLYKWQGEIIGEAEFKRRHPLLQTRVVELIGEELIMDSQGKDVKASKRKLMEHKLLADIEEKYPGLVRDRLRDPNILGDSEELGDIYKILVQDLKYGYASTSHKAQASTYMQVFIDETDFEKIQDKWSYKYNKMIRGSKERNQLKYVAFSRASKRVVALYAGM